MASNSEWLARKLLELEQQVQALGRGTRLGHSSLQGGSILALDEDGKALAELGTEGGAGGVVHLDGPEPPRPTAPVLEQGVGTIFVRWDGAWDPLDEGDEGEPPTTPIDFDRIEVHATTDPEATEWDEDTLAGSITQRNGGVVMIRGWDIDDVVIVRLVCRSLADKLSEPSEPAEVTVTGIDIAAIAEELDAANLELSNLDGTMFAVGAELDALAITFKNLDTSIINTDDGTLAEALDDARQALEDARDEAKQYTDTGVADARAEIEAELDTVRTTADGKNRTYYQSTMPGPSTTPAPVLGDLWFNTANGYRLHRHNGTTFVEVADGRIAEVEDAVENIDISGPLSEARTEWLADAAADAQAKASAAAAAAEAAAKLYADAVATGAVEGELEGIQDYADQAAEAARQAAIDAAVAEARVIANSARDEALAAALDADAVISQSISQFESDLSLVRESADGKNSITWSPNAATGPGKAGDTWFRMSGNSIIGHWRHSGSAWVSMSLDAVVIPNLDAGKINSGFIDSARIAAGSITTEKITAGAVGATAIAAESIDASKIVAGGIQADSLIVPGSVGSTLIKDGAITTSKIEAGAITAQSGIIASLDAGVINSGHIDSARIAAASITADKILVGGAGNLLTNPGFTGGGAGWNLSTYNPQITASGGPTGEPVLSIQHSDPNSPVFPYLGGLVQSAAGSFAPDLTVVEAGKRYVASVWVRAEVDIPVGNAGMGFRLRELGSSTLGWAFPAMATNREVIPANTWAKIEGEFLVPEGTGTWNRLAFGLRANGALNGQRVEFSAPVLLPKVGATLIEDDAITTGKIAANAIGARAIAADAVEAGKIAADSISGREIIANTVKAEHIASFTITADELAANSVSTDKLVANSVIADKLAANSVIADKIEALAVTADKLAANAVTADKIAANAITAGKIDSDAINGMVITGATVRTSATGQRVEMNADGLVQYNAQGQPIVDMTGGTFSTVGSLQTGRPGDRRVIISNDVWSNPGTGIVFVPEGGEVAPAHASRIGTPFRKWLEIAVEEDWTSSGYRSRARFRDLYLELTHSHLEGTVEDGPFSQLKLGTVIGQTQDPAQWFLGGGTRIPNSSSAWASHVGGTPEGVSLVSQEGFAWIKGGDNVQVESGKSIVFGTSGGSDLSLSSDSSNPFLRSRAVMNRTYSYAANVYVTASGILSKSTSARRYKTDEQEIAPAEYADALLSIPFKSWVDKKQIEQQAELDQFREDNPYCPTPEYLADVEDGPPRHVGAVAEDFIDAGLEQFVTFDQYGRADGLQYDRIGVALIPIIRGMKEQIDRLEAANGIGE